MGACQGSIPTMVIQRGVCISAVPVYGGCGEMFLESITQGTGSWVLGFKSQHPLYFTR